MLRADLQSLSKTRLKEAHSLLRNGHFSGAYYLAGYAAECALKACIAKNIMRYQYPDKKHASDCYTHNLADLLKLAALNASFTAQGQANQTFLVNWGIIKDWNESCRYIHKTEQEAKDMYAALTSRKHGFITWVKRHW
jgi:hypothetical protein